MKQAAPTFAPGHSVGHPRLCTQRVCEDSISYQGNRLRISDRSDCGLCGGDKLIHVDTGTGIFVQGDVITIGSEGGNNYVINSGFAGDGDGDITLGFLALLLPLPELPTMQR